MSLAGCGGRGAGGPAGEAHPTARQVRRAARPSAMFMAVTGGGGGAGDGDRAGGGVPERAGAVRQVRARAWRPRPGGAVAVLPASLLGWPSVPPQTGSVWHSVLGSQGSCCHVWAFTLCRRFLQKSNAVLL